MLFSTLPFTFIVTFLNGLLIFFVIIPPATNYSLTFYCMGVVTMLLQAYALFKYDTILTKYYWAEVRLSSGKTELEELVNSSNQGILIFNRKSKKLIVHNKKAVELLSESCDNGTSNTFNNSIDVGSCSPNSFF